MKLDEIESNAVDILQKALVIERSEIVEVKALKKGMTNRSFLTTCKNRKYIVRIPGAGTGQLINRHGEAHVYREINGKDIGDDVIYIDPENGYKVTRFLERARCCDSADRGDVKQCIEKLRAFHELKLVVDHEFDIFGQLVFYESLWDGKSSAYGDYTETKEQVLSLRSYIETHVDNKVLTHIDAVPDNFLFIKNEFGKEEIRLIDWEYAGMQDPHVDLAMFAIYSFYDRRQIDELIQMYFGGECRREIRLKIYCYVAACGLLWSNWCEYKRSLGVEFGGYALRQYQYAKEYCQIVKDEIRKL